MCFVLLLLLLLSLIGGNTVFGSGKVNVETWRCSTTLRGHNGDVLDMAWSPHDAWLATCSVDNTVIVWNALKMPGEFHLIGKNWVNVRHILIKIE